MNFPKPKYKTGEIVTVNGVQLTIVRPQVWPDKVEYLVKESPVHLFENEDGSLYTDKPALIKGFDKMGIGYLKDNIDILENAIKYLRGNL